MPHSSTLDGLIAEFRALADPERARNLSRYFKTGPGGYGEGDVFIGLRVPVQQKLAKKYQELPLPDLKTLLSSSIHEHRLTALMILRLQYERLATEDGRKRLVDFYMDNVAGVNNWDLVDCSAPYILGDYLRDKPKGLLDEFARSDSVWRRRIAVLAAGSFIRFHDFESSIRLAEALLNDPHHLIHKAVGWMLREVGNRDRAVLRAFLDQNARLMPRTMLRYAIEKLPPETRKGYLAMR